MSDVTCSPALFRFGLITDIQHADKDDTAFEDRPQRYRQSLGKLQAALADLQQQTPHVQFVLTLGDIIDGYAGQQERSNADLQHVAKLFDAALPGLPVYHTLGNHCCAASRSELLKVLHMPNNYYSLALGHGWRLVVLDTTEMSLHSGLPEDSEGVQQARAWLVARPKQQHPNAEPWNGGCTAQQLTWLRQTLATAAVQGEQVLVACHHPVVAGSARRRYLAWGHEQLQAAFDAHTRVVRCVFSGHYHPGGYMCAAGIHYVVYQGVLEAPPDSNAYAVVEVHADRLVVAGRGVGASMVLPL